jgi:two-component system, OmpR family, response regulator
MRLLLVEDDMELAASLIRQVRSLGYTIDHQCRGPAGLTAAETGEYDVLIVDRMLPALDGLTLVRRLRERNVLTPVIILTGLGDIDDRVDGLDAGADDYLVKPFAMTELLARARAQARRRSTGGPAALLTVGSLQLDRLARTVTREGHNIELLPQEFRLLEFLMQQAGDVVTRSMLLERVWNIHFDPQTSVVESHMSRLRAKLNKGHQDELIVTIRGEGYLLRAAP